VTSNEQHGIIIHRNNIYTETVFCIYWQVKSKRDQKKRKNRICTRSLEENFAYLASSLTSRRTSRQPMVISSTGLTNSSMTRRNCARLRRINAATCSSNRCCFSVLSSSFVSCHRWSACSILRVSCHDISGFLTCIRNRAHRTLSIYHFTALGSASS